MASVPNYLYPAVQCSHITSSARLTHQRDHISLYCAASIPVVGFNAILMSEHFGSFLTFGVLHGALAIRYVKVSILALVPWTYSCGAPYRPSCQPPMCPGSIDVT